jgi:hypothetical protein
MCTMNKLWASLLPASVSQKRASGMASSPDAVVMWPGPVFWNWLYFLRTRCSLKGYSAMIRPLQYGSDISWTSDITVVTPRPCPLQLSNNTSSTNQMMNRSVGILFMPQQLQFVWLRLSQPSHQCSALSGWKQHWLTPWISPWNDTDRQWRCGHALYQLCSVRHTDWHRGLLRTLQAWSHLTQLAWTDSAPSDGWLPVCYCSAH